MKAYWLESTTFEVDDDEAIMVIETAFIDNRTKEGEMSTTFGIKDPETGDVHEIAFRANGGAMRWLNPLARILPNEMKAIPLNNSAQGIETVGDIRVEIDEYGIYNDKEE